jgi:hypothetical protein
MFVSSCLCPHVCVLELGLWFVIESLVLVLCLCLCARLWYVTCVVLFRACVCVLCVGLVLVVLCCCVALCCGVVLGFAVFCLCFVSVCVLLCSGLFWNGCIVW